MNNLKEEPTIEEVFISPTHIDGRPTGKTIGFHILELLKTYKIDIKNCRAQAYDGASAMESEAKGASAVIKGQQPMADSIHGISHYINLAITFACKNETVSKFMDDLTLVFYFFSNSHKSQNHQNHVIGFTKTRWVERHKDG